MRLCRRGRSGSSAAIRSSCSLTATHSYYARLTGIVPTTSCSDTCAITATTQSTLAMQVAVAFDSLQSFQGSCFPSSPRASLGSRLPQIFWESVVTLADAPPAVLSTLLIIAICKYILVW